MTPVIRTALTYPAPVASSAERSITTKPSFSVRTISSLPHRLMA